MLYNCPEKCSHIIDNGTNGECAFGLPGSFLKNWKMTSKNASKVVKKYTKYQDKNIVICIDTPFLMVAKYLGNDISINTNIVLNPQSTEISHATNMDGRFKFEQESFAYASNHKNIFIGYVSSYFKRHLIEEYNVKKSTLISFKTGVDFLSGRLKKLICQHFSGQFLKRIFYI